MPLYFSYRRSSSAPSLIELRDDFIAIPEDYVSAMLELDRQRRQIREMRVNQANARELQFSQVEFLDEKQDTEVRQLCLAQSVNLAQGLEFLPDRKSVV